MAALPQSPIKSRLERRVLLTFSMVTILPTLAVLIFSTVLFNVGVQAWFNRKVNTAVEESLAVAHAYLDEHRDNIRVDALGMAAELSRYADMAITNPIEFNRLVSAQASSRSLTEVVVFRGNRIVAQGRLSFSIAFETLPLNAIEQAARGEVVILQPQGGDEEKVRALVKLDALGTDAYLLVGRLVDERVITHLKNTQGAVSAYQALKAKLAGLRWTFSAAFVALGLLLLMAAMGYGRRFAAKLTTPVARLSQAADRVRAGDYSSPVYVKATAQDELAALSRTFNRMMEQLDSQRRELMEANRELDGRRHFTEAVLAGVSAGVVALDREKRVTLSNRSAAAMLGLNQEELTGKLLNEYMPGIHELIAQVETGTPASQSMTVDSGGKALTLHVRVAVERGEGGEAAGYIVTFDDITPLVAAQRNAAWSDVARRVAHEIKNPLTPIALSAERLKRKYMKALEGEEAELFAKYTDTIARHVADIGRMVDEFVSFARMPGAELKEADVVRIIRGVVFSEQVAHPAISYHFEAGVERLPMACDERQLAQALSNLLKNAAEAIEGAEQDKGRITVQLACTGEKVVLSIEDNGSGFPPERMQAVLEPYVTTRAKGTGLGLAIVKKIIEEHKGTMELSNRAEGGACVTLSFLQQCDN